MTLPALDLETYSEAGFCFNPETGKHEAPRGARSKGLPVVGTAVYTEHPTFEVLTASYDLRDGRGVRRWRPGEPNPQDLFDHLAAGGLLECHNLMFEYLCWENGCTRLYGWPSLAPFVYQLRCSAAKARVASLPGALGNLAAVLGTSAKDKEGTRLMKVFSMPRDPTKKDPRRRILPHEDPEQFEAYRLYCDRDVEAEQAASAATPPMSDDELVFWMVDQEINRRGIAVDRPALRDCMAVLEQALEVYGDEFRALTGGLDPTQLQATKGWLAAFGVRMDKMDEDAIDEALARLPPHPPGGSWAPRRVLEIRQLIGSASVKKLYAMEHQANRADRLLNLIIHHGARTGRPTGEGPQPLNLPRAGPNLSWCACGRPFTPRHSACPWCGTDAATAKRGKWSAEAVDHVLEIMATKSLPLVEWFFGDALLSISGCLRGLFVAGPGMDLIASDYSAIEAVVIAMLAGEQWRIDAFRENKPIYLVGASKITGTPLEEYLAYYAEHGDHHPDRQTIGKVSELACLGPDTLVLTSHGWKPIENVADDEAVHDGTTWVRHGGVVDRGVKHVMQLAGITVTPDHKFWAGDGWRTAYEIAVGSGVWGRVLAAASHLAGTPLRPYPPTGRTVTYDIANAGPRNRFVIASGDGPVIVHNCGFGGWIGSYKAFGSTEPDDVIKAQILAWRAASPAIVDLWGGQYRGLPWDRDRRPELFGYEGMAIAAIQNPGQVYDWRGVRFFMRGDALIIRLLSGRELTYWSPRLYPSARRADELSIVYMTWNSNPKYGAMGWVPMETYGGRLTENVVQATAHDILRYGILGLRAAGYPTVLHVYDEIVVEVPAGAGSVEEVERIMATMPDWACDEAGPWPISAAGGYRAKRYRKG